MKIARNQSQALIYYHETNSLLSFQCVFVFPRFFSPIFLILQAILVLAGINEILLGLSSIFWSFIFLWNMYNIWNGGKMTNFEYVHFFVNLFRFLLVSSHQIQIMFGPECCVFGAPSKYLSDLHYQQASQMHASFLWDIIGSVGPISFASSQKAHTRKSYDTKPLIL